MKLLCSWSDTDAIQVSAQLWGDWTVLWTVKKPIWGGVQEGIRRPWEPGTEWGLTIANLLLLACITVLIHDLSKSSILSLICIFCPPLCLHCVRWNYSDFSQTVSSTLSVVCLKFSTFFLIICTFSHPFIFLLPSWPMLKQI